jgi:Protein of unknown function (DUF732)
VKKILVAAVVLGIWLSPNAYAAPQDQAFLAFLAANNVAIDPNTAITAVHIACAQVAARETITQAAETLTQQVPTINGNEYWIVQGAREIYCPDQ